MIYSWFLQHQWREMMRASIWQKNIALNIVLGFLIMILLMYLLMIGLFLDKILEKAVPEANPVNIFNGLILYYFGFEFFLRFFIQSLPTLNIETYLHLPIKKSSIVNFVAGKSVFGIGNYLMLLVVVPFTIKVIMPAFSVNMGLIYIGAFQLFVFANNFLATYIKRQLVNKPSIVAIFGILLVCLVLLDYFHVLSLSKLSAGLFNLLLKNPVFIVFPFLLVIFTYALNYFLLLSKLYPEDISIKKQQKIDGLSNIRYLNTLGLMGRLISLDLRLIWRHKRTKSMVYMAPLFLGYGFFFYPQPVYQNIYGFLIFVGIFMTGGMMLNYVNYCFGYESNYFDNVLVNYTDFEEYIRAKYVFAISISTVCFVLTIPYLFFGMHILLINAMTFLYNIGFLSFVLFYFATHTTKRMDLSRGAAFNYQGLGASHWLAMIPAFLLPVFIYLPFSYLGYPVAGLLFVGALGVAGLLFNKTLTRFIYRQFMKKRYAMAEGFRE